MAFSVKYSSAFEVVERPQGILATYSMTFSKDGYSGAVVPLRFFGSKAVVAKISNDSTLGICSKKLDIEILENIDLSELQKANPREWKVDFYKTVASVTTLEFSGWLIPTSAQTDYVDGLKYVRLEANDGLAHLKNLPFVNDSNFYYDGTQSVFEIIRLCLVKTGLSLKINTINNTFADGNDGNLTADAMKQRYLDMDLFRGENDPQNTYDVLQNIIITEKCRIFQEQGEWWIENIAEKKTGYVNSRKYYSDGSFISGNTINLGISAVYGSNYQPFNGGISNVMPVKSVKIEHKLAGFKNKLLNKDFSSFSSNNFNSWTKSSNSITLSRDGDGTTGNLYGPKIGGFSDKNKNSLYIYQNIELANSSNQANINRILNSNILFKGSVITQGVKKGLVQCLLFINVDSFSDRNGNYPQSTTTYGLDDSGNWIVKKPQDSYANYIELENFDINNYAKKTPKTWDITSKKINELPIKPNLFATVWTGWQQHILSITVQIRLLQGVTELNVYPGETQQSYVIYKKVNVGWVNADTNLNLREIDYKATTDKYSPNNETYTAIYGDYVDASNLSAIKDVNGNLTSLWTSSNSNTLMNFHKHGAMDILRDLGATPKVYDGSIRGLIRYRHSVAMAGIENRGYITSYTFDYASTEADVRIVEHGIGLTPTVKKTGVLSDGTEISMVDDSPPSPVMGNGMGSIVAGSSGGFSITSWLQQLLSGVQGITPDDEAVNVVWDKLETNDTFDFGSVIRRDDVLKLGPNENNITLGNFENDSLTKILGRFGIENGAGYLAQFSIADLTANRVVTMPDRNIEINKWTDISGVPSLLTAFASLTGTGVIRKTETNSFSVGTNDAITLSGDATGTGTTAIAVTLANSGVTAGTYRSVTVDAKGRVTAGTNPTTISGYGITDFASNWLAQWNTVKAAYVMFGQSVEITQNLTVNQDLYVYGKVYDSVLSAGSNTQFARSTGTGFIWTSLNVSHISNFSTSVLNQVLTGLTTGNNTALSASNTILTAFQNLQAQITNKTTAEKLVFGNGYFQNSDSGLGFKYKPSALGIGATGNNNYYTGEFNLSTITGNRTYSLPDYNGTLTTYEKVSTDFWKLNGNNVSQDGVFDIINATTAYNYLWKINGQTKMQLTPAGNMSVGGIAPEAVIHAHATVVGNTEVIALKASNNVNSAYFSIGIDSTNNRTNLYSGGEVWATTISKFKFGVADVSGLWTYSVIPQTTADATTGNQLVRLSQVQALLSGGFAVSTACKLVFVDNQSLSGAKTQGGYTTITGDNILLTGQSTASQNGVYVFDGTNWARNTANDTDSKIRNKGHLITNGSYANTQWVNNNASTITVGTTAITYAQWSGAETDPIWEAYKTTNNLTPTRFANWDLAFGWGNHANLYVDKTSAQNNIAGAKVFTTSIQSPIVKAGSDSLNITISNISGTSPRVASNGTLDFAATTRFDWLTTGNIGRMRLTTTGLRIGSTSDPLYTLHAVGTIGFDGLISLGRVSQNIAMSSGSVGQFIRRSLVNNGFYDVDVNEWANITTNDITGLSTNYQAKLNGTGFVKMNGTTVSYEQYSEFGRYLNSYNNFNIFDAPVGASFVGGLMTQLPNNYYIGHSIKMAIGADKPNNFTFLGFGLPNQSDFDGRIYVRGLYDGTDTGWKMLGGDIANYKVYRGEAENDLLGYYYENIPGDKSFFVGYDKTRGEFEITARIANQENTTITEYRNFVDMEGRLNFQLGDNEPKRYLLSDEVSGGTGSLTYTPAEPIYFSGTNNSVINVRTASASQAGVLTAADWIKFNAFATGDLNFTLGRNIFWRNAGITDANNYAAKLFWGGTGTPFNTNVFTGIQGIVFEADSTNMNIGSSANLNLKGNKIYLNGIEISMAKVASLLSV